MRSSLLANVGAHGASQAANFAIQLMLVPVLAQYWGLETYGVWLILFTLPFYLAVGDFGLTWSAATDMTAAVAQGRKGDAVATFQATQAALLVIGLLLLGVAGWLVTGPLNHWLAFAQEAAGGQAIAAVMLIVAYGISWQQVAIAQGGLRATGAHAAGVHVMTAITVLETAVLLAAVMAGATIVHAAAIYCAGHIAGAVWLRWLLRRHAPWLRTWPWRSSPGELRRLARPALAMMLVPICFALTMQGPTLVLGAVAGAAIVPAFAATRTLSRAAVQLANIVSTAAMPGFTVATARGERERKAEIFALAVGISVCMLVPTAVALVIAGQWFMHLWTGGVIVPSLPLIATLAVAMLLNGVWVPISNLILASNQHERYSYVFLAVSVASVGVTILLARPLGALGAALSAVLVDSVMLGWIVLQSFRLGLTDPRRLLRAPITAAGLVHRNFAARLFPSG